jgi:hypothetical protein
MDWSIEASKIDLANVMHVEHTPQALDTAQQAPTVDAVIVSGVSYSLPNNGWRGGQLSLGLHHLSKFDMEIAITLGAVDDTVSTLKVVLEHRSNVLLRQCYLGESFQVRSTLPTTHCTTNTVLTMHPSAKTVHTLELNMLRRQHCFNAVSGMATVRKRPHCFQCQQME